MISVELWRARILGTASCRGCSSVSLSSFFFHFCTCRTVRSQVKYSSAVPSITVRAGEVEERSPAAHSDDEYGSLLLPAISIKRFLLSYFYLPLLSSFSGSCSLLSRGVLLLIAIILSQLLIMSGDIETNPGPKRKADDKPALADLQYMSYTGDDGREVHFRLKTRLKPHWRDLAIALQFLQNDIANMESKDDPVYYILTEWRRGANQENDPRPVTWRTLITALRHANIQDEATVLETHLVDTSESVPQPVVQSSPREHHSAGSQSTSGGDIVEHREVVQSSPREHHSVGSQSTGGGDIVEHQGSTKQHGPTQPFVKFDVPKSLLFLMKEYASMLVVLRTTKLRGDGFLKIKLFLSDYCDEMSIRKCSNMIEVIDFLTKELKIHMFNIETLSGSCSLFKSRKVERSVQQYKHHLDEFLSSTKVKEFKHALDTQVDDYSKVESITLKLDEPRSDDTFKALKKLAYHIFGVSSKAMVYRDTHPGCICVTWVVPVSLVPTLRAKARQHSHVYLARQGVLELVIGLRIAPNEENTENLGVFLQQTSRDGHQRPISPHVQPLSYGPVTPLHKQKQDVSKSTYPVKAEKSHSRTIDGTQLDTQPHHAVRRPYGTTSSDSDQSHVDRSLPHTTEDLPTLHTQQQGTSLSVEQATPSAAMPLQHPQDSRTVDTTPVHTHLVKELVSKLDQHHEDAALPLTRETYRKKFTALLYFEEDVHNKLLKDKCNRQYQLLVKPKDFVPDNIQKHEAKHVRYAYITGMSGDQMMNAAQASECVNILRDRQHVAKADILLSEYLTGDLLIAFDQREAYKFGRNFQIGDKECRVLVTADFEVKHSYFNDLRRSLNNLSNGIIERIVPTDEHFSTGLESIPVYCPQHLSMELDKEHQSHALQLVLQFSQLLAPVIISGPFGTGKTRVLAVAAYNFIEYAKQHDTACRVLVCSHHQYCADIFVESFFGPLLENRYAPWGVRLVRLTRKKYSNASAAYRRLYVSVEKFNEQFETGRYTNAKHLVVVTTFITALNVAKQLGDSFFTHILLDDGAQVREPEAVAPLCMANRNTKIVIAGDCQQVGPAMLVLGDEPQRHGLAISLLERLQKAYKYAGRKSYNHIAHLCSNYRCHKDIHELSSRLLYGPSLIPMAKAITHLDAPYPLVFVCSSVADPKQVADDTSMKEADILIDELRQFCKKGDTRSFLKGTCFMALSRGQVTLLQGCLKENKFQQVNCFPSYEIQGREFKALFVSTVECVHDGFKSANPTKSFCNRYVFNTALTRAQSLVVVAGNPFLLLKVEAAMPQPMGCWREYLRRCIDNDTLIVPEVIDTNSDDIVARLKEQLQTEKAVKQYKFSPKEFGHPPDVSTSLVSQRRGQKSESGRLSQLQKEPRKKQKQTLRQPKVEKQAPTPQPPPVQDSQSDLFPKTSSSKGRLLLSSVSDSDNTTATQGGVEEAPSSASDTDKHVHQDRDQTLLSADLTVENYKEKFHQLLCREEDEHEKTLKVKSFGTYKLTICHYKAEPPNECGDDDAKSKDEDKSKDDVKGKDEDKSKDDVIGKDEDKSKEDDKGKDEDKNKDKDEGEKKKQSVRYGYISADDGDKIAYIQQACENEGKLVLQYKGKEYYANMVTAHPKKRRWYRIYIAMLMTDALKLRNVQYQYKIFNVEVFFELKYSYFDRLHKALDLLSCSTIQRLIPTNATYFSSPMKYPDLLLSNKYKELLTLDHGQRKALNMIVYAEPKAPVVVVGSFGTGKTQLLAQAAFQIFTAKHEEHPRVLICAHHQASADAFLTKYFIPMKEKVEPPWKVYLARMIVHFEDRKHYPECYRKYYMTSHRVAERIERIQLVVTTFANTLHLAELLPPPLDSWFTHILIDEGAQTREPETIAPLFLCGPRTVVALAGDHKQVGPSMLVLGDDPQNYGLGQSLIERLHSLYDAKTDINTENHCATLLTNYRCHQTLLALPSYLFYHSALVSNRNTSKQALLHPDTTYSLHFICSSLDDTIVEVKDSTNEDEAKLLLNAAANYVKNWPPEWGEKKLQTVCVIAATANQQHIIRKVMKRQELDCLFNDDEGSIEILKAYDMQGREFQCVFFSTAEPTYADGASRNPTKTPCSQYVFNTALTRAKSLVVCAGNPFLLMKIEKMTKNRDKRPFWAEYIRCCMVNETFVTPAGLCLSPEDRQKKINKLERLVFKSESHMPDDTLSETKLDIVDSSTMASHIPHDFLPEKKKNTMDSITMAYKRAFESLRSLERCQVHLKYAKEGLQWKMEERKDDGTRDADKDDSPSGADTQQETPGEVLECNLEVVNDHKALGHPLDFKGSVVTLKGSSNRKGAFDGDVVNVKKVYEDSKKTYGKVVGVVQKCHQEKYVCWVDRYSTLHLNPIDRKVPTFVNLPRISKDLLRYSKDDIKAGLESQDQLIVVFEEDSLPFEGKSSLPRIKGLIPACNANNLLFVVREIGWDPNYRLPLGAVVESLPLGTNSFHAERLLRAAYSVVKDELDEVDEQVEWYEVDKLGKVKGMLPQPVAHQTFAIDPSKARNLDDALSLVRESDGTYTMSVHIANVGGQLKENSDIDKRAQARGQSIYDVYCGMIPTKDCQKYSLAFGRDCDVLTVSTTVKVEQDGAVSVGSTDPIIKAGKVRLQVKLDYSEAQYLISNHDLSKISVYSPLSRKVRQYSSFLGQPNLPQSLKLLYRIAMHFRLQRLGQAGYAYDFTEESIKEVWQAHLLVAELMGWANASVAKCIYQHLPNFAVLRRQESPLKEEMEELVEKFGRVIDHSVTMSKLNTNKSANPEPLLIPHSTLLQLHKAVDDKDAVSLQHLLTSDNLYPQLAAAKAHLRAIRQRAEYVCGKRFDTSATSNPFYHDSECFDYYTHFTSPLRRYCDVVVQRILLSILNNTKCSYKVEELDKICRSLNVRCREATMFQKEVKLLDFAKKFGDSCEETHAYVHKNQHMFQVNFPELKYQSCLKKPTFHISALVCEEDEDDFLKWTTLMYSFKGNDFISINPKLCFSDKANLPITLSVFNRPFGSKDEDKLQRHQFHLIPIQNMMAVDAAEWQNIITKVGNLSEDTIQQLSDVLPKPQIKKQSFQTHTFTQVETSTILKYEVKHKLGFNSVVPVWLGQTLLHEHILTPCIQLMEVAPELRICLQHNTHPAECFSDPHFGQASKAAYTSLEEYVRLWEKVYLAEVAHNSVQNRGKPLTILKNVPLKWPKLEIPENSTEDYCVPDGAIELIIPPEKRELFKYRILINTGDLVCVRYDVKEEQCRAVYHFVVIDACEDDGIELDNNDGIEQDKKKKPFIIRMKHIGKYSCQVSQRMKAALCKYQPTCEMQVINIQESHHRVYKLLVSLKNEIATRHLMQLVALGKITEINSLRSTYPLHAKPLDELKADPMAYRLWSTHGFEMNSVQKEAIEAALTNCFQLIQGPPGTGKSETGAHIAYIFAQQLKDHECVVYCAPSNEAVDVVHEKLLQANKKLKRLGRKELKLLRFYGKIQEKLDYPGPYTSDGYLTPAEGVKRCKKEFEPYALHHLIRRDSSKRIEKMEEKIKKLHSENAVPSPFLLSKYKNLIKEMERTVIDKDYDIILATCNECSGRRLSDMKDAKRVAQVIVDECGMALEPETIAAISLSDHVVLIGDHKQLQPVVKCVPARENGLRTSLFQRYAENYKEKLITLTVQYRMHENICKFPSERFYQSSLETDQSVKNRLPVKALSNFWPAGKYWPLVFCDVDGTEKEMHGVSEGQENIKPDQHSKCNPKEAKIAVKIALILQKKLQDRSVNIAIITPYSAQKEVVTQVVNTKTITVRTVTECQGKEYDYVILSTVRSQPKDEIKVPEMVEPDRRWLRENLGFLTDPHQVNVAITRAKQGLIIVGNLTLLEYEKRAWNPLIEFYKKNGCVVDADTFLATIRI